MRSIKSAVENKIENVKYAKIGRMEMGREQQIGGGGWQRMVEDLEMFEAKIKQFNQPTANFLPLGA